jgi:hypoxanthine phosphoribosyltransferase
MKEVFISKEKINKHVNDLSEIINSLYKDEDIVMLCVLNGAFMFFSDLIRKIENEKLEIDFIKVKSYDSSTNTKTSNIDVNIDLKIDIKDKIVFIVEDIVASGDTINNVIKRLEIYNPKDIIPLRLVQNEDNYDFYFKDNLCTNYNGIIIDKSNFVAGYGLDNSEKDRHLEYIYVVK